MRICLLVEGQEGVSWDEWRGLARASELYGLEGLHRSDHYLPVLGSEAVLGSLEAWATLAGIAAITERIRLGTLVSPVTFRHPSELAKLATTVDHISGGRVELGLGAGWHEREHRAFGFDFPELPVRLERLAEQVELIHGHWTQNDLTFSGRHYWTESLNALPKPIQEPHPRLIVGGSGRRGTVLPAVRFADEYNLFPVSAGQAALMRRSIIEVCEQERRDPASLMISMMTGFAIGSDYRDARERARRAMELWGEAGPVDDFIREREDRWIIGTLEEARDRLQEYEGAGIERIYLQLIDHRDLEVVKLLGKLIG